MVFLTGGNGPGARHAVGVRLDGESGNPGSAHQEWETLKLYPYVPSMLARGEHLYFVNDAGIAACALARTGEIVWQQRLGIGNVTASPLLIDGKIYTVSENGQIKVFAAETAYREIAEGKLDEGVLATPAVADGRLLIRGSGHLYCFGTR
jgi:outer membrane protein assembly factor BamB